eukprot:7651051-Prorocentrum_lima.AAC.1
MVRLRSPSAATAARSFRATRAPCKHHKMVSAWRARRAKKCEPPWRRVAIPTMLKHESTPQHEIMVKRKQC